MAGFYLTREGTNSSIAAGHLGPVVVNNFAIRCWRVIIWQMEELRTGTWLLHMAKHLGAVDTASDELSYFDCAYEAGKAGSLRGRMAADTAEIINCGQLKVFARAAGVRKPEISTCLRLLKNQGRIDFTTNSEGEPVEVEVYIFSSKDAIETTARIFGVSDATDEERGSIVTLEETFHLPLTKQEMLSNLHRAGCDDESAEFSVELQVALRLVKSSDVGGKTLYFNEYAFADDPMKVVRAFASMNPELLRNIRDVQDMLKAQPGYPLESLKRSFPHHALEAMEGIGLIDVMPVRSPNGIAMYVTIPQLRGVAIGEPFLSADVFHKAKTLLNCLRYGQFNSRPGRGKIVDDAMLRAIVAKLVRGEELAPSTAAAEDYRVLEKDGVIETREDAGTMRIMKLRQLEVGRIVLQMLDHNAALPEADYGPLTDLGVASFDRDIPEVSRSAILAHKSKEVIEAHNLMLQAVRTGGRSQ